ncbi:MAG TPA: ankyrin repeat domain-containing protein [Vicinamibacterales bacterium]|nr:ankyrin repeat domain-containing protein [Vicinamibacterales bacterium]
MTTLPTELIGEFIDAAEADQPRALALLQKHPNLIHARWVHGESLVHFMAVEGFYKGVKFLAEHGADVNAVNEFGDSPLIDVATLGRDHIAELLLQHGANPNAVSKTRDNALHIAVLSANERMIRVLLEGGADPRYRTDLGESVFDALPASGPERDGLIALLAQYGVTDDGN